MLTESRERVAKNIREPLTHAGTAYLVRSRERFTFNLYRVGGYWCEPNTKRQENQWKRERLASVAVQTDYTNATAVQHNEHGKRERLAIVRVTVRGDYSDVWQYVDTLTVCGRVCSLTDGSGLTWELTL